MAGRGVDITPGIGASEAGVQSQPGVLVMGTKSLRDAVARMPGRFDRFSVDDDVSTALRTLRTAKARGTRLLLVSEVGKGWPEFATALREGDLVSGIVLLGDVASEQIQGLDVNRVVNRRDTDDQQLAGILTGVIEEIFPPILSDLSL